MRFVRTAKTSRSIERQLHRVLLSSDKNSTHFILHDFLLDSDLYFWKLSAFLSADKQCILALAYIGRGTITKDTLA